MTASTCVEICGDAVLTISEECDDQNFISGDGCSNTCLIEDGYLCDSSILPSDCVPICGDSKNMIGEFCDDGDISSADKCEGDCSMPVTGWICTGGSPTTP